MPPEALIGLMALSAAATWTPGPNNLMLAGSGANFGFRRTIPHMAGIIAGFPVMIFLVALGIGGLFLASPILREIMRWAGAALLLWFAWRIMTAGRAEAKGRSRPLTFLEAAGFQWINPKGWAMSLAATSQFVTGEHLWLEGLICAGVFALNGLASTSVWALFGVGARRLLNDPARLRVFNIVMGLAMASFVVFLLKDAS